MDYSPAMSFLHNVADGPSINHPSSLQGTPPFLSDRHSVVLLLNLGGIWPQKLESTTWRKKKISPTSCLQPYVSVCERAGNFSFPLGLLLYQNLGRCDGVGSGASPEIMQEPRQHSKATLKTLGTRCTFRVVGKVASFPSVIRETGVITTDVRGVAFWTFYHTNLLRSIIRWRKWDNHFQHAPGHKVISNNGSYLILSLTSWFQGGCV